MPKRRLKPCINCNSETIRIDEFDCVACKKCMIWVEAKCSDDKCCFCSIRPDTPVNVNWEDSKNT